MLLQWIVLDRDCKGYVHGMDQGISKKKNHASAASRLLVEKSKKMMFC